MNQCVVVEGLEGRPVAAIEQELLTLNANLNAATCRFLVLARGQMRVAHALVGLPDTAAAFSGGRISYSKVRAMSRVATAETEWSFPNVAKCGTAAHLERIARYAKRGLALDETGSSTGRGE